MLKQVKYFLYIVCAAMFFMGLAFWLEQAIKIKLEDVQDDIQDLKSFVILRNFPPHEIAESIGG